MKISLTHPSTMITLMSFFFLLLGETAQARHHRGCNGKKGKKKKGVPAPPSWCFRPSPYSVSNPNPDWNETGHTYHPQVWYLPLDDIYELWSHDYFDYVLDMRGVVDHPFLTLPNGDPLPAWPREHMPGALPFSLPCLGPNPPPFCNDPVLSLDYFRASGTCLDARIFVHCFSARAANMAVEQLVQLGFTNIYAAGPEGNAGWLQWKAAGYPVVYDDEYNAHDARFIPQCYHECQDYDNASENARPVFKSGLIIGSGRGDGGN